MQAKSSIPSFLREKISKRRFLSTTLAALAGVFFKSAVLASNSEKPWDLIVIGGGTAGLPAAIFASLRGARVLIVEAAAQVGGTLFLSTGQMSAAGTRLQKSKSIEDSPQAHYDDVMRISEGTANPEMVHLAVFNAATTFDWLMDKGLEVYPEHPVKGLGHEPYSEARYSWGIQGGISLLQLLERELQPEMDKGNVFVVVNTKATELIQDTDGSVSGLVCMDSQGNTTRQSAKNILLSCGGYASNPKLIEELERHTKYADGSYPYSQGAGILLGTAAGGYVRGGEFFLPNFGNVLEDADFPARKDARLNHHPHRRQPWEIYVNVNGQRFIREDEPSVHTREKALLKQPEYRYWIVLDDSILNGPQPIVTGWTTEQLKEAFSGHPMFYKADSLTELAVKAGIDSDELSETVADYNVGQLAGADRLGREHLPAPIAQAPYYAIRVQGCVITSTAGLAVDSELRVIRKDGTPVPNLYAAGELLGHGLFSGRSRCGGMSVTPALTFGRLLGEKILKFTA